MTDRDEARLRDLHPELAARVARVLMALDGLGWPMTIVQGRRTAATQAELYAQGRTKPGPIVTNADGVTHVSKHQTGRAADLAFLDRMTGQVTWSEAYPWRLYGEAVAAVGLLWGGTWKPPLVDRPHAELPPEIP